MLALLVGREFYQVAQPNYLNVLYILCVIGVIVYGILVYRGLKSEPIAARSAERLRRMKRVRFPCIHGAFYNEITPIACTAGVSDYDYRRSELFHQSYCQLFLAKYA
mgnify:CR=1 FL=1